MGIGFLVLVATEAMLGDTPYSKAVVLGRVAGAAVVIAALALGIKVAVDAGGDQFWVFLAIVTTPMGIGFLVLVATEAMLGDTPYSKAVVLGRVAGAAVVIAALALGIKVAVDAGGDQFWVFLGRVTTPIGIGFLVLVAAEAMLGDTEHSSTVVLGRVAGAVVVIAALAYGIKFAGDAGGDQFWMFLETATIPMGIGFLVLVLAEAMKRRGSRYPGVAETS